MKSIYEMSEAEAKELLIKISTVFGIGSAVRNEMTILTNAENAVRRSACLSRIEHHHSVRKRDDEGETYSESLLNWGEAPEKYIETYRKIMAEIRELQNEIHANAREKGWWLEGDEDTNNIMEKLMLVVTEIAEAAEEHREHRTGIGIYYRPTDMQKPEGFGIELADAVIRILDLAEYLGIDMQQCIVTKMRYNSGRPHRHGDKRC